MKKSHVKPKKRSAPKGHAKKKSSSQRSKKPVRKAKAPAAATGPVAENPQAKALAQRIASLTLDKKAVDVVILDVRGKTSYADYFVLASGESERQVTAMADGIADTLKNEGYRPIGTEGHETGHWVLLDYGEVVAHFFYTEVRSFYDLEGLWADARREPVLPDVPALQGRTA